MGIAETVSKVVSGIIEEVSGDTKSICADARTSNVDDWKAAQIAKAVAVGGGAAAIPVAGYFTLLADLGVTLRIMHRAATGICLLRLGHADDETFSGVLAVWSGAVTLNSDLATQMAAKSLATGASIVGGPAGLKMATKAFAISANVISGKKLGVKVSTKVATKITTKLGGKALTRWIPVISAIVGGGFNWWIVNGICDSAEEYCKFIRKTADQGRGLSSSTAPSSSFSVQIGPAKPTSQP